MRLAVFGSRARQVPHPVIVQLAAAHAGHLIEALAGQGEQSDDRSEGFLDRIASSPHPTQFVARQCALARWRGWWLLRRPRPIHVSGVEEPAGRSRASTG